MNEPQDAKLRDAYRAMTRQRGGSRASCVSPDELMAVAEGTLGEADRLRVLTHVGTCERCRYELDMLRTAAEAASHAAARPAWLSGPVLAAAAGLVVLLGGVALWQRGGGVNPDADVLRTGPHVVPALIAPTTATAAAVPVRLVWSTVVNARRYHVEILDTAGIPLYGATTQDTVVDVPATVPLVTGAEYRYWVRALLSDGTEARSEFRRFHISTP
jgi:hypothetical protein